ncbi:tetratricopeptide repeat protein 39B-like [Anguilla anguilla]|uniref:tetratricopeptide repeat protein 39B-like n=1 Tax=Anguilla anguilla TaxID=7936 RepID=UPI0015B201F4|nr:tetratricopeptide repeat protein 39B-like [Anguilla anguilla]
MMNKTDRLSHVGNEADRMNSDAAVNDVLKETPMEPQMDLRTALEESERSLNLFHSNKFSEALALLEPRAKTSVYHAMGHSSILLLQAGMTFDPTDIQNAMASLKEALQTCQRFRRKYSVFETIASLFYTRTAERLSEEEMHAEICYAECLLHKAALTFLEDETMIGLIKSGIKIRSSYQIFKECLLLLNTAQNLPEQSDTFKHFQGGVNMGIGSFNLMLSLMPNRVLRLLEFIGFSGNREFGLSQLRAGAASNSLRSILCVITLLVYYTYITVILGTADGNLCEAEALLEPYIEKYPNGSVIIFYVARIAVLKGNLEEAQLKFLECTGLQQEWRQIHHLCYWELMWCHCFRQEWLEAYRYADLLCTESKWSRAVFMFQKAAILSMLPEEDVEKTGENVVELFRQVDGLMLRLVGKSIPTEKFVARKARRYSSSPPVPLTVPALEMMYVWNGFSIVGKRAELTANLLTTLETAEQHLSKASCPSEYHFDDQNLLQMLKGLCLKHLGRLPQAELCFTQVISSEKKINFDHYLVPFSMYELGLIYKLQGDFPKATSVLENAKLNYKDYSMESRLHFRIHAALDSLKDSTSTCMS